MFPNYISPSDLGDGKFQFAAAGNALLEDGILHFEKPGSMTEWVKYQDRAMPDTTTTDTTTTTVTATTVTTVEPTKESEKVLSPLLRSMVGEYFDKKGNIMTLTLGPWQYVTVLMRNKNNHIIMHDSGTVENEVTDKLVKFNRLGLSRFNGDRLNFFEGKVWTRKSIQLKSSIDQVKPVPHNQPVDGKKSLFSITKSNYRIQSNADMLTIQLS